MNIELNQLKYLKSIIETVCQMKHLIVLLIALSLKHSKIMNAASELS